MAMTLSRVASLSMSKGWKFQASGGEIIGILKKIKDADPADFHHASLDAAKKQDIVKQDIVHCDNPDEPPVGRRCGEGGGKEEVVTLTATIVTNLRRGEAEEKEEVATATESATWESVVLVSDPIVSAPWSVLFGRGEPCETAVKTRHTLWCRVSCVPMTCSQVYWGGRHEGRTPSCCSNGDDGSRKRGLRLLGGSDDVAGNGFSKLLNVAGVLMVSTLVSCVQRFSMHDLLLVVVFLVCFFMRELADVGIG